MKKLFVLAAVLMATSAAHAGDSYSFEVGGRTIHIDAPSGCDSPSCVSISIPGVYESKRGRRSRQDQDQETTNSQPSPVQQPSSPAASASPAVPATPAGPAAPAVTDSASSTSNQSLEPANGVPASQPSTTASLSNSDGTGSAPSTAPNAGLAAPVVALAPVSAPVQNQQAPVASKPSPLGVWLTEEKEGKVRIEPCGSNLCGYSVDAKSEQNGEKVLINMKAVNDIKWSGRIHDPKSGSNYDSTIALKGSDSLRVQGCAFGGMFCGGQTWSRVN